MLEKNPKKRIGNTEEIKKHKFFKEIEWNEMEFKRIKPPLDLVKIKEENGTITLSDPRKTTYTSLPYLRPVIVITY